MSGLASLVGTWVFEPTLESGSPGRGTATFRWSEDRTRLPPAVHREFRDGGRTITDR